MTHCVTHRVRSVSLGEWMGEQCVTVCVDLGLCTHTSWTDVSKHTVHERVLQSVYKLSDVGLPVRLVGLD